MAALLVKSDLSGRVDFDEIAEKASKHQSDLKHKFENFTHTTEEAVSRLPSVGRIMPLILGLVALGAIVYFARKKPELFNRITAPLLSVAERFSA